MKGRQMNDKLERMWMVTIVGRGLKMPAFWDIALCTLVEVD
jgi:hypothetical protein